MAVVVVVVDVGIVGCLSMYRDLLMQGKRLG
jgi:hypothetical protein